MISLLQAFTVTYLSDGNMEQGRRSFYFIRVPDYSETNLPLCVQKNIAISQRYILSKKCLKITNF